MAGETTSSASVLATGSRWRLIRPASCGTRPESFLASLRDSLSGEEKAFACRFLYDARGSELFERICKLQSYYPTRAEARILSDFAGALYRRLDGRATLVELGSGSSLKTSILLREGLAQQAKLSYVPIDISPSILETSARRLTEEHGNLEVTAVAAEYRAGLRWVEEEVSDPLLVLWLGGSIGNFEREDARAFLDELGSMLRPDDRLLVGIDLRKERDVLEAAYDDDEKITEAFIKNILVRANKELGANFEPSSFRYEAVYDELEGAVRMSLVSRREQKVRIEDLSVDFRAGEEVHVEDSHKYSLREIERLVGGSGLRLEAHLRDPEDRFSLNLLSPKR